MEGRSMSKQDSENIRPLIRESFFYAPEIIEDIQAKSELGRYRLRGFGTLRKLPKQQSGRETQANHWN